MAGAKTNDGSREQQSSGPATDRHNSPVVDPSDNVRLLTEAAVKRLDDLANLREAHAGEIGALRAEYDDKLRDAESKRIDAIRAVDVGAVNRAAEVSATQASTLAAQVATSAETLRTQVAAAASAASINLAAALGPIQKDIADLRRAQYEAQGKQGQVVETRQTAGASSTMVFGVIAAVVAGLSLIGGIVGLIIATR